MELKDVYTALEKVENGAELITAIKAEINTLNNEAKKNRIAGEQNATKLKNVLEAVGLADGDDVVEKAKGMKATLDQFAQGGKKPDEVAKQITTLTKQVETVTTQLADMTKQADEQRAKYIASQKMAKAVEALTKGNAAAPKDMAKLLLDNIKVNDDDSLAYTGADGKDVSVEDGVNSWLKDNAWAVKVNNNGGGGGGGGYGITIIATEVTITGSVAADGGAGESGTTMYIPGGGGGGGGDISIIANVAIKSGSVTANGGSGGTVTSTRFVTAGADGENGTVLIKQLGAL